MNPRIAWLTAAALLPLACFASAGEVANTAATTNENAQIIRERNDLAAAPIQSQAQLESYVAANSLYSPLNALPPADRALFISSLTFNNKGLTGFRQDVFGSLTPSQAYRILALFGAQSFTPQLMLATPQDETDTRILASPAPLEIVKGYHCEGVGTCRSDPAAACTGNC